MKSRRHKEGEREHGQPDSDPFVLKAPVVGEALPDRFDSRTDDGSCENSAKMCRPLPRGCTVVEREQ